MNEIIEALKEVLDKYDRETKPITESEFSHEILSLRNEKDTSEPPMQWIAEAMAFDFYENHQSSGWGTYYGPMFVFRNNDGTATESPSITKVTEQMIGYWSGRAQTAQHPVLRARYADLVWDFSKVVTKKFPHHTMAQIAIDSIVEIAQGNYHKQKSNVIKKLERALSLALSLNDTDRINKVRDIIITYEDSVTEDSKLGLWGFSYDLLYDKEKVKLTSAQSQKLIDDLEEHLSRASQPVKPEDNDPWATEASALRLAKHYRKIGQDEDVQRVIMVLENTFIQASSHASALQASGWLQHVHGILLEHGISGEVEKVSKLLREIGAKVQSELKPLSHTFQITSEEIEKYVEALIDGESEEAFARIVAHYIPKKSKVKNQLKELASKAPLQFLIPMELQDKKGRPVAKLGPIEDDLDGHIVKLMYQNMALESIFLRQVMETLIKKYPTFYNMYVDYLYRSPIFEEERKLIIELGVKEYINGNHITAVHLLIPQIENAIRVLLEKAGGSVLKPARGGGFNLKILDELLRDPLTVQVFGEDIVFYFRALLVDPRGWNLRNCVCHGLYNADEFGASMSDRVIHVLLCLALVRKKPEKR